MERALQRTLVALVGGVIILAACGDTALSRDEFVAEFEAVCQNYEAELADLGDRFRDVERGSDEERRLIVEQGQATQTFTDGVRALRPPAELEADHAALITQIDAADDANASGDFDKVQAASEAAESLIEQMGIDGC